jgi:hypothetical protein
VSAWLGLIVLQVVTSQHGSGRSRARSTLVNRLVKRALSPDVAAIPDYRNGTPAASPVGATPARATSAYVTVGGSVPVPSGTAGTTTRKI